MTEIWASSGIGSERVAMVHAFELLPPRRRKGMDLWTMRAAAIWARDQGAETLSVMCTRQNAAAVGLYTSLGMTAVEGYHYRLKHPEGRA